MTRHHQTIQWLTDSEILQELKRIRRIVDHGLFYIFISSVIQLAILAGICFVLTRMTS